VVQDRTALGQVGQESVPLLGCVWGQRLKMGYVQQTNKKSVSLLHIGHKSSGWFMLSRSLPFAVPTHS